MDKFFRKLLEPELLKKIYGVKDAFVYRYFFRMLTAVAKGFPGSSNPSQHLTYRDCERTYCRLLPLSQEVSLLDISTTS